MTHLGISSSSLPFASSIGWLISVDSTSVVGSVAIKGFATARTLTHFFLCLLFANITMNWVKNKQLVKIQQNIIELVFRPAPPLWSSLSRGGAEGRFPLRTAWSLQALVSLLWIRTWTTSSNSCSMAMSSGVLPRLSFASSLAPAPISSLTTWAWPEKAAKWRAVVLSP